MTRQHQSDRYWKEIELNRDEYWNDVNSHRMEDIFEVDRLIKIATYHYHDYIIYDSSDYKNLLDFVKNAKRPYGNKDILQSIAYNLGWDHKRVLCRCGLGLPDFLKVEAERLHNMVILELSEKQ